MTANLSTTYLGLDLPNPIIASSSPLTENLESLKRLEAAGASAVVLPSLYEEQIEHEAMEVQRLYDYGSESLRRSAVRVFPRDGGLQHADGGVPASRDRCPSRPEHPGDRQPQRHDARRLDPLRRPAAGGRGPRPGAQHLPDPHRPLRHRRRHREAVPRSGLGGACRGDHSAGREDRPVLQLDRAHGPSAR